MQRAGLRRDDGSVGAEVAMEYLQRLSSRRGAWDHEGVVIARNGEDRSRIVSERLVELIVIVLRLAETVDDVAEVEEERRAVCIVRAATIHGDLIRDSELIEVFARIGSSGIAECMKDDLSRILDRLDELGAMTAVGVLELKQVAVGARDLSKLTTSFFRRSLTSSYTALSFGCWVSNPVGSGVDTCSPKFGSWKTGCGTRVRACLGMIFHPSVHVALYSLCVLYRHLQQLNDEVRKARRESCMT